MSIRHDRWFALRQVVLVAGSACAYFGVRGITEGNVSAAQRNARDLLRIERSIGLDLEQGLQTIIESSHLFVTLMNWVYIWLHWPVLIATLWWLLRHDRAVYTRLRDAMIISGAIGVVIFALLPMAPPRLFDVTYIDTVTLHSHSYRVLQPPMFVNKYAAFPSLHFGWNLLAGIVWFKLARRTWWRITAVVMPTAMAVAVVATGNHWVIDVVVGGAVALVGDLISWWWNERRPVPERTQRTERMVPGTIRSGGDDGTVVGERAAQTR